MAIKRNRQLVAPFPLKIILAIVFSGFFIFFLVLQNLRVIDKKLEPPNKTVSITPKYSLNNHTTKPESNTRNGNYSLNKYLADISPYLRTKTMPIHQENKEDIERLLSILPNFVDTEELHPMEAIFVHLSLSSAIEEDNNPLKLLSHLKNAVLIYSGFREYTYPQAVTIF